MASVMSIPRVPGTWSANRPNSLWDLWDPPVGTYPQELWPQHLLLSVVPQPTEWFTVAECYSNDDRHGGRNAVLAQPRDLDAILSSWEWVGKDLGGFGLWSDGSIEDGLSVEDDGVQLDFLAQIRSQQGVRERVVDIALPFLWYWGAIQEEDGWYYLNRAGRDQPLIRYNVVEDHHRVEIRALELRQYLMDVGRVLIAQVDHVTKLTVHDVMNLDDEFSNDWANFSWHCGSGRLASASYFSRLVGQYAIHGVESPRLPIWKDSKRGIQYPEFQYDLDRESGQALTHTCDPAKLGTFFDRDRTRLHYLTPAYFTPDVLDKYIREPNRYSVSATRLSCLDLWGVAISHNTVGLVEVYLGDIGRDLPADEWSHWQTHNVPPEGAMAEDRVRRDFLNQWESAHDPVSTLRTLRNQVNERAAAAIGGPIWRPLSEPDKTEWDRLHFPVSSEPRSLNPAVLTLTKAMVDAIDVVILRKYVQVKGKGRRSLALLQDVIEKLNGDKTIVEPLRALQNLRSRSGIAHMAGRGREKALVQMDIKGKKPQEAFETIVGQLVWMLQELDKLFEEGSEWAVEPQGP